MVKSTRDLLTAQNCLFSKLRTTIPVFILSEIWEIVEQWVADLENQIVEAEIALSAPEVTVKDLQNILNGPYPTTIEEFKSMISQRHLFKLPISPPNLIG